LRIKRFEYTDQLGWSFSRYQMFKLCKRQYYYHYYGRRHDPESEKIEFYRDLTSIPLQIGTVLHRGISTVLKRVRKNPSPLEPEAVLTWLRGKTHEAVVNSRFLEQEYSWQTVEIDDVWDSVRRGMENFLASNLFGELHAEAASGNAKWLIEPTGYGEMRIGDLKAYCKADFIRRISEGYTIFDWKSGRQNVQRDTLQLTGYAHYVSYHFEVPVEDVTCVAAYVLPEYLEIKSGSINSRDFVELVARQTEEMYAYCEDGEANVPKSKEHFERTDIKAICRHCNYQAIC
jgi:hypothetical protein